MKSAFCPPRVREFRVAQVSAPRPGKPVPLSPAESHPQAAGVGHDALRDPEPAALRLTEQAIIELAAAGLKDEVIARKLGISVRTCRACIAHLIGYLDACATGFSGWHPRLRDLGFPLREARISALRQLVLQAPAPVIAGALGFHHTTTTRQAASAGSTWSRYAAAGHDAAG